MQWQRAMSRSTPAPWPASAGRRRSPRWKSTRFRTFLLLYASNFFSTTKVGHERNSVAGFLATLALYAWALGLRLLLRYGQMASFLPFLWSGNVNNCQELLVVRWVPNVNSAHFLLMPCYRGHRTTALLRAKTTNLVCFRFATTDEFARNLTDANQCILVNFCELLKHYRRRKPDLKWVTRQNLMFDHDDPLGL